MTTKELNALDLMIEDLHISRGDIRVSAKQLDCEEELNHLQREILLYLINKRGKSQIF